MAKKFALVHVLVIATCVICKLNSELTSDSKSSDRDCKFRALDISAWVPGDLSR